VPPKLLPARLAGRFQPGAARSRIELAPLPALQRAETAARLRPHARSVRDLWGKADPSAAEVAVVSLEHCYQA